jgi:hypothetical protein
MFGFKKLKVSKKPIQKEVISYTSEDALMKICSADDILDRFSQDPKILFEKLRQGNFKILEVYPRDDGCMCNMGWGKRPYVNKIYCVGCEFLRRVSPSVRVPENKEITIGVGKYEGMVIRIRECNDCLENYTENSNLTKIFRFLMRKETELGFQNPEVLKLNERTTLFTTGSFVSNYIATNIFLNNKLEK